MRIHVMETIASRQAGHDTLVESDAAADPPGDHLGPEAVAFVCGACGRRLWTRARPGTARPTRAASASTVRRVVIACPSCEALNVLPPAGGEVPS